MAGKLSAEEEVLLQSLSSNVSTKSNFLFYTVSTIISLGPIYLSYAIHLQEPVNAWMIWIISVIGSSVLLGTAYRNMSQLLKDQIIVKRGEAIARKVSRDFADKKISKLEKEQRIIFAKNEVGNYQATTFSIFYNNVIFIAVFLVLSSWILTALNPSINCVLSMFSASGLALLLSTSKQ